MKQQERNDAHIAIRRHGNGSEQRPHCDLREGSTGPGSHPRPLAAISRIIRRPIAQQHRSVELTDWKFAHQSFIFDTHGPWSPAVQDGPWMEHNRQASPHGSSHRTATHCRVPVCCSSAGAGIVYGIGVLADAPLGRYLVLGWRRSGYSECLSDPKAFFARIILSWTLESSGCLQYKQRLP